MKIAIVGSRDYQDLGAIKEAVAKIAANIPDAEIVSGGARGVDTIAVDEARRLGLKTKVFPADWDNLGKAAGYIRNEQIILYSDKVLAFWDGVSKGTKHSIDLAKKHNKQCVVLEDKPQAAKVVRKDYKGL